MTTAQSLTRAGRPAARRAVAVVAIVAFAVTAFAVRDAHATTARPAAIGSVGAKSTMLVDDYPYKGYPRGSVTDVWRFYNGYCTSFVAWRINDLLGTRDFANHSNDTNYWAFKNFMGNVQFGNADTWDAAARALGWAVDNSPRVGDIAQWHAYEGDASNSSGGHVAVVTRTYPDGYVDVEEYNWSVAGQYDQRVHVKVPRFIHVPGEHVADVAVPPFATSTAWVNQVYQDLLGRQPTANEIAFWVPLINSGYNPDQMLSGMLTNVDSTTQPVVRAYLAFFKRAPDPVGYAGWVSQLQRGAAVTTMLDTFAGSPEFNLTYGQISDADFITLIYKNVLGRAPDPQGQQGWTAYLAAGMTRGQVMGNFSESPEFKMITANKVDVARVYLTMLRRPPDPTGWTGWSNSLAGGMSLTALINAIRGSGEYAARFG